MSACVSTFPHRIKAFIFRDLGHSSKGRIADATREMPAGNTLQECVISLGRHENQKESKELNIDRKMFSKFFPQKISGYSVTSTGKSESDRPGVFRGMFADALLHLCEVSFSLF